MRIASILIAVLCSQPLSAEPVDWRAEIATDAVLAGSSYIIERFGIRESRYGGTEFPSQDSDDKVHLAIHGKQSKDRTAKERRYRELSNVTVISAASLPVVIASFEHGDKSLSVFAKTGRALLLGNLVITATKYGIRRPRPDSRNSEYLAQGDQALSFPSGHSSAAFTGATLVALLFPTSPWWVKAGGFTLATLTAVARIGGNKHYFTDVVVGGMIGAGSALTVDTWDVADSKTVLTVEPNSLGLAYRF